MLLNEAKFAPNGHCGYILKPKYLRGIYYARNEPEFINIKKIKITIISGQHIPKATKTIKDDIVDPYVILRMYGHSDDHAKHATKVVKNNGI